MRNRNAGRTVASHNQPLHPSHACHECVFVPRTVECLLHRLVVERVEHELDVGRSRVAGARVHAVLVDDAVRQVARLQNIQRLERGGEQQGADARGEKRITEGDMKASVSCALCVFLTRRMSPEASFMIARRPSGVMFTLQKRSKHTSVMSI